MAEAAVREVLDIVSEGVRQQLEQLATSSVNQGQDLRIVQTQLQLAHEKQLELEQQLEVERKQNTEGKKELKVRQREEERLRRELRRSFEES